MILIILSACDDRDRVLSERNSDSINKDMNEDREYKIFIDDDGRYPVWAKTIAIRGINVRIKYTEEEFFSIRKQLIQFCENIGGRANYDRGFFVDQPHGWNDPPINGRRLNNSTRQAQCENPGLNFPKDVSITLSYTRTTETLSATFYLSGIRNKSEYDMIFRDFEKQFVDDKGKSYLYFSQPKTINDEGQESEDIIGEPIVSRKLMEETLKEIEREKRERK